MHTENTVDMGTRGGQADEETKANSSLQEKATTNCLSEGKLLFMLKWIFSFWNKRNLSTPVHLTTQLEYNLTAIIHIIYLHNYCTAHTTQYSLYNSHNAMLVVQFALLNTHIQFPQLIMPLTQLYTLHNSLSLYLYNTQPSTYCML